MSAHASWADADDRALVAAHVGGDADAFTELVRRHRDRLWAVALRTTADREEAADALQEALISAYRNAASYRGDAAVTTWLHRVVVNACLDRLRRRKARPADALGDREVPSRRDEYAVTEARLDVRAALATLPEGQRVAIVLVDMEDLSVAEAAQVLGVAEGTVKSRCSRGRAALALLLRPAGTRPAAARDGASGGTGNRRRRSRVAPPGDGTPPATSPATGATTSTAGGEE